MNTRNLVRGNTALAAALGVTERTVRRWRQEGLLAAATVVDIRRTIVYDLDKVAECLRNREIAGWK